MILAAGLGKRLKPLTETSPKALLEINGVPMLEVVLRKLMGAGVSEIIVNVFHRADAIVDFLKAKRNFGIRIEISRETELLDTGGGLKKAAYFFDDGRPFFLHNVDVYSDIDLKAMLRFHRERGASATLGVRLRDASRYFLFDPQGQLCGWESRMDNRRQWVCAPRETFDRLGFDGVHVLSPDILPKITETGVFPIHRAYLRLAGEGEKIQAFRSDKYYWQDIGTLARLKQAQHYAREKGLPG